MPSDLVYEPVEPRDRESLLAFFASSNPEEVAEAIYSATYHDPDWRWVQDWCLRFLKSEHIRIRWAAATCLGDLAMFHKRLDLDAVVPALREAATDPAIESAAQFSLSLIEQSVKIQ